MKRNKSAACMKTVFTIGNADTHGSKFLFSFYDRSMTLEISIKILYVNLRFLENFNILRTFGMQCRFHFYNRCFKFSHCNFYSLFILAAICGFQGQVFILI